MYTGGKAKVVTQPSKSTGSGCTFSINIWFAWEETYNLYSNVNLVTMMFKSLFFICCCSVAQSYLTLCNPMDCTTPGFLVLHYLPQSAQTHVHWGRFFIHVSAAAAKSLQSCPTLWDPIDGSPLGFCRLWDSPGKNTGVGCHFLLHIHVSNILKNL